MKATNEFNLTVGTKIDCYYSNGTLAGGSEITRVEEKSCYMGSRRETWNTVNTMIKKGFYVIK